VTGSLNAAQSTYKGFAADALQRPLRSRFRARLKPGIDMIGMATACAKRRSFWRKRCPNHQTF
jgi:hypothetical protein